MAAKRRRFTPSQKAHILSKLLEEQVSVAGLAEEYRISPVVLNRWKNHVVQNMHKLFENERKSENELKTAYEHRIEELQEEADKLRLQLEWLKQAMISRLPKEHRNELVTQDDGDLPIRTKTALLGLSRSTLYYRMNHGSPARRSPLEDERQEAAHFPAYLFASLSIEPQRSSREKELSKLKIINGWMDVFGGYH
ncbi:transposase [Cohnella sp. LGH]|uniref:transposase n=1 Tax=Cohnella sp. LGH TaxID=1619153 RepID=UPI001ADC7918|nr:transposase [Cohnella sp. LGH]QTH44328.1 transposase [Cohnella sp. LGH]